MPGSQNLLIILRRLLVIACLAAVFCLSAAGVMYMILRGRTVEVPNVVGKSPHEAEAALSEHGLRMQVRQTNDDNVPVNAVSVQSPAAGVTVKTGQLVRVSVSQGAARCESRSVKTSAWVSSRSVL